MMNGCSQERIFLKTSTMMLFWSSLDVVSSRGNQRFRQQVLQLVVRSLVVGVGVGLLVAVAEFSFGEGVSYLSVLSGLVGLVLAGGAQSLLRVMKSGRVESKHRSRRFKLTGCLSKPLV